jgi:hypothetical protein
MQESLLPIKPLDVKNPNQEIDGERLYSALYHWFHKKLPESLYHNHYSLAEMSRYTPSQWKKFLKMNEQFISSELAAITEANARSALKRIAAGQLRQGEANALKQLLDRSEQINSNNKNRETIVMHFIPPKKGVTEDGISHAEALPQDPVQ